MGRAHGAALGAVRRGKRKAQPVNTDLKVLTHLYDLPRLFGVWIVDPEYREALGRKIGQTVYPVAQIYLPYHVVHLQMDPDEDGSDEVLTSAQYLAYGLEGTQMILRPLVREEDGEVGLGEESRIAWAISDDVRLNLNFNEQWWRFVPTDLDGLRREGFHEEILEGVQENARNSGMEIEESFDIARAERLIQEEGGDPGA